MSSITKAEGSFRSMKPFFRIEVLDSMSLSVNYFVLFSVGALILNLSGLVLTAKGSALPSGRIELVEVGMQLHGVSDPIRTTLSRYYDQCLGGESYWSGIQSIGYRGTIKVKSQIFNFTYYSKRPDYCKLIFYESGRKVYVSSYDGNDCWEWHINGDGIHAMPEASASDFIRDAKFGGHLLYSDQSGKSIELDEDVVMADGSPYQKIRVILSNDDILDYYIGPRFFEDRRTTYSAATGRTEELYFSDHRKVGSLYIPHKTRAECNGEVLYELSIERVIFNAGVVAWMFSRSAERIEIEGEMHNAISSFNDESLSIDGVSESFGGFNSAAPASFWHVDLFQE